MTWKLAKRKKRKWKKKEKTILNQTSGNRQPYKDIVFFVLLISVIVLLGVILFYMTKESTQCLLNPLKYDLEKLAKENNSTVYCNCYTVKTSATHLYVDSDGNRKIMSNLPS